LRVLLSNELRERVNGGACVQENAAAAVGEKVEGRAGDGCFCTGGGPLASIQGKLRGLEGLGGYRAAVHAVDDALTIKHGKVAPNGLGRDFEAL